MTDGMATSGDGPESVTPAVSGQSSPARRLTQSPWRRVIIGALVGAALLSINQRRTTARSTDTSAEADVKGIVAKAVDTAIEDRESAPPAAAAIYASIQRPLVVIQSDRPGSTAGSKDTSGLGSGVIINAKGSVLTALHVVEGATRIRVSFTDGTESAATIESSDVAHDIAVLTPEKLPEVVTPAVLGSGARVGDETFAVGHPLGLVDSLSAGVISGLDRSFPLKNGRTLTGLIQFDAAVNPGSSGGPLLNRKGQVIGIVTGLANPSGDGDFIGIGFAVPIATAGGSAGAPSQ